jgi:hypothetical protein
MRHADWSTGVFHALASRRGKVAVEYPRRAYKGESARSSPRRAWSVP